MIPEDKKPLVERALREAFGVTEFEDIRELTAGLSSALIFRIVVRGQPYLLRVDPADGRDCRSDATVCLHEGGRRGGNCSADLVHERGGSRFITDFVNAKPFSKAEALARVPATIRTLHALPPFPRTVNYLEAMDRFIENFRSGEYFAGERDGGCVRALRASERSVSARRRGHGVEPQRFEAGECFVRWRTRLAGGLGGGDF